MNYRFTNSVLITAIIIVAIGSNTVEADNAIKCATRPDLAGPCYEIRGRLNAWNGGPATEKIWVVGTKRLLAVYNRSNDKMIMPKAVSDQLNSFDTDIYADYLVCPFEKEKPGNQSYVCIDSAKNIRVERHELIDGHDHVTIVRVPDAVSGPLVAE